MTKTLATLAMEAAQDHNCTIYDLRSTSRKRGFVQARWDYYFRAREAGYRLTPIGDFVHRDHAGVIHGLKQWEALQTA